jgi:putative sigma-54 modulation protein
MLVKFNAKDFKISDKTLESMENKIHRRFDKYFNGKESEAVFYVKLTDQKKLKEKVELTLPYCGYQLRAEVADKDGIIAALDKGMDIMERQITKCKTKLSRNKHQTPEPVSSDIDFEEEPSEYAVVKTKKHELKPMSVQEAVMNMNMLGHDFYMFRNSERDAICVVYRRKDGDYGLIEPM